MVAAVRDLSSLLTVCVWLLVLGACSGSDESPAAAREAEVPAVIEQSPDVERLPTAGLSGQILYKGGKTDAVIPGWAEVPACAQERSEGALVVGAERGLSGVVVTLVGTPSAVGPGAPVELLARGCRYEPRVVIVPPAHRLQLVNEDPILHTFHLRKPPGKGKTLGASVQNIVVPPGTEPAHYEIKTRERLHVRSDKRDWMKAIVIAGGPDLQTVTDAEGRFSFEALPAGTYRVRLWHELLGTIEEPAEVTVPVDGPGAYYFSWTDASGG